MPMMIRHWPVHDFPRAAGSISIWIYCSSWKKAAEIYGKAMGHPKHHWREPSSGFRYTLPFRPALPSEMAVIEKNGVGLESYKRDKTLYDNPDKPFFIQSHGNVLRPFDEANIKLLKAKK